MVSLRRRFIVEDQRCISVNQRPDRIVGTLVDAGGGEGLAIGLAEGAAAITLMKPVPWLVQPVVVIVYLIWGLP